MYDGHENELKPHLRAHAHGVDDPRHGAVCRVGAALSDDLCDCVDVAVGVVNSVDHANVQSSGKKESG